MIFRAIGTDGRCSANVPPRRARLKRVTPRDAAKPRLYGDLARLWPLVSPAEDYAAEAAVLGKLLRKELRTQHRGVDKPRVLEMGAGGGHILHHLCDSFDITASDLSPQMLAQCRRLNPGVPTIVGDMRSLRLGPNRRGYDAVLIQDAIDYMLTPRDISRVLATAWTHLRPGGVLIVAPTYVRETFRNHDTESDQRSDGRTTVTYLCYIHDPNPADTWYDLRLVFLIAGEKRGAVRVVEDRHRCGLFSVSNWIQLMAQTGFAARAVDDPATTLPHVLLVGRKANS